MKTPKELEEHYMNSNKGKGNYLPFADFIKQIQDDAYNQAIEDAVNNAECYDPPHEDKQYALDRQSILKLKK